MNQIYYGWFIFQILLISQRLFAFQSPLFGRIPRFSSYKLAAESTKKSTVPLENLSPDYGVDSITVLTGLDPVRKRPGMYIGSTGTKGLHHLVYEIVDNSVDEALAGHCTHIQINLEADGSVSVRDNGRGIPCEIHPSTGKSTLETVLCILHAGGKFGGKQSGYQVSGGLHGVGISVVNALSSYLIAEVIRNNQHYSMTFAEGKPMTPIEIRPKYANETSGTYIRFYPDKNIFKTTSLEFDFSLLSKRLNELSYLNAGLNITLTDYRKDTIQSENYVHLGGIKELVEQLTEDKVPLPANQSVLFIKETLKNITVEVALRWSSDVYTENIFTFANNINTFDGGSHLDGLKTSITKTLNNFVKATTKNTNKEVVTIPGEYLREGLTAVINVKLPDPEFEGQTKTRLGSPEVRSIVDTVIATKLSMIFEWNPSFAQAIISKALQAQSASLAAKAARDLIRKKSLLTNSILPGKLVDCSSRNASESEIYIVEGDSAAGSAKLGRDRKYQAILPLKGKILNIEKASPEKIYQNSEIQAIISALGLGVRNSPYDPSSLRYHKIAIMTDADVDGAHIRLLLLTFFYRYQRDLLTHGHVYIACPPLYKLANKRRKQDEHYFYNQESLDQYLYKQLNITNMEEVHGQYHLQRFKGLGEMMPIQLWDTTMNPETRILRQVTVEDAMEADRLFAMFMGDFVEPRKQFIMAHADSLRLSDLDI